MAVIKRAPKRAAKAAPKKQPHWLTHEHMAASIGISPQAFRQWKVPPAAKIGRCTYYEVRAVLDNRLANQAKRLDESRGAGLDDAELVRAEREEKLRLTTAQAAGQEIKNAQLRNELAPVAVIEWVVGKAGAQIGAVLDALPLQLKKRNPRLTATDIETIRREIVKAQNAASQITVDLDEYYDRTDKGD